jgi:hypothetical protein
MTVEFIPCTVPRAIGEGVFFRPIKSWHSGTYAGEGLEYIPGSDDRIGCLVGLTVQPKSVTHRLYWHERDDTQVVSAFLSYPGAMGYYGNEYFWEVLFEDVIRFGGDHAESEMEEAIRRYFRQEASVP